MNKIIMHWFVNIVLLAVIILGVVLIFCYRGDSVAIITTMIGIPITAFSTELGFYSYDKRKGTQITTEEVIDEESKEKA